MLTNQDIETLHSLLDAGDVKGALKIMLRIRASGASLDDAHKILLADAILRPEWKQDPPPAPNPPPAPTPP